MKAREQISKAIREEWPSWVATDGACRHCWESFRGVARVLEFIKGFKFPRHWRAELIAKRAGPTALPGKGTSRRHRHPGTK